jgi:type VI secretion system protein VasD
MALILRMFILIGMISCAGCLPKSTLMLKVHSDPVINPTSVGDPLPVIVKIYQLSEDNAFLQAQFQELWKQDQQVLSSSLVAKKEVQIHPNNNATITFKQVENARYLAVVATFLDTQGKFRDIIPLHQSVPGLNHTLFIDVSGNRITFL